MIHWLSISFIYMFVEDSILSPNLITHDLIPILYEILLLLSDDLRDCVNAILHHLRHVKLP